MKLTTDTTVIWHCCSSNCYTNRLRLHCVSGRTALWSDVIVTEQVLWSPLLPPGVSFEACFSHTAERMPLYLLLVRISVCRRSQMENIQLCRCTFYNATQKQSTDVSVRSTKWLLCDRCWLPCMHLYMFQWEEAWVVWQFIIMVRVCGRLCHVCENRFLLCTRVWGFQKSVFTYYYWYMRLILIRKFEIKRSFMIRCWCSWQLHFKKCVWCLERKKVSQITSL